MLDDVCTKTVFANFLLKLEKASGVKAVRLLIEGAAEFNLTLKPVIFDATTSFGGMTANIRRRLLPMLKNTIANFGLTDPKILKKFR
ncbi:hypothetical protein ACMA1I_13845 [Pontibacter sp. 13R65]|uniref:hypothetical protein n=1 Tax=Pontibacter sp. 13R65 TaxID=3127458 RepID=UPI00301C3B57